MPLIVTHDHSEERRPAESSTFAWVLDVTRCRARRLLTTAPAAEQHRQRAALKSHPKGAEMSRTLLQPPEHQLGRAYS